jgi:hypothetical protein
MEEFSTVPLSSTPTNKRNKKSSLNTLEISLSTITQTSTRKLSTGKLEKLIKKFKNKDTHQSTVPQLESKTANSFQKKDSNNFGTNISQRLSSKLNSKNNPQKKRSNS